MKPRQTLLVPVAALTSLIAGLAAFAATDARDLSGTWSNDRLTLQLAAGDGGVLQGTITLGGKLMSARGTVASAGFTGVFESGGSAFPFSLARDGDTLVLTSGKSTYRLTRRDGAVADGPPIQPPNNPPPADSAAAPELPAFLKPGVRILYQESQSMIHGASSLFRPTVNDVEWRDNQGRVWNMTDERNSGGAGFTALDIVHATPDLIGIDCTMYLQTLKNIEYSMRLGVAASAKAGIVNYWKHPALLQQIPQGKNAAGEIALRVKYNFNGQQVDAITISSESELHLKVETWDLQTGLILQANRSTYAHNAAGGFMQKGNVAGISVAKLVAVRQRTIPGADVAPPEWAKKGATLKYTGGSTLKINNGNPLHTPGEKLVEITVAQDGCFMVKQTDRLMNPGSAPIEAEGVFIASSFKFGNMWLSPAAIAKLKPGEVLDEDAVTKRKISFAGLNQGTATIIDQGGNDQLHYLYDVQTGMLVGMRKIRDDQFGRQVDEYQLAR